jgi:hypothetical protein
MDLAVGTAAKPKCHMPQGLAQWFGVRPHKRGPLMTYTHCIRCLHVRLGLVQTVGGNLTACMAHSSPRPSSPAPLWRAARHQRLTQSPSGACQLGKAVDSRPDPPHKSHTYTLNTLFLNVEGSGRAGAWSADLGIGWAPRLGQGLQARVLTPRGDPVHTSLMWSTPCFCAPLACKSYKYSCGVAMLGW